MVMQMLVWLSPWTLLQNKQQEKPSRHVWRNAPEGRKDEDELVWYKHGHMMVFSRFIKCLKTWAQCIAAVHC